MHWMGNWARKKLTQQLFLCLWEYNHVKQKHTSSTMRNYALFIYKFKCTRWKFISAVYCIRAYIPSTKVIVKDQRDIFLKSNKPHVFCVFTAQWASTAALDSQITSVLLVITSLSKYHRISTKLAIYNSEKQSNQESTNCHVNHWFIEN